MQTEQSSTQNRYKIYVNVTYDIDIRNHWQNHGFSIKGNGITDYAFRRKLMFIIFINKIYNYI